MLKKVILSSCLLCTNLFTYEIDLKDIDTSKNGIVLGTFFAKNKAFDLVNNYPQFDTYIKEIETTNTPYYVVFALNINKNEHNLIFEIIKKQTKDAFKTSSEVIHELTLDKPQKKNRTDFTTLKREKPFVRKGVEKKQTRLSKPEFDGIEELEELSSFDPVIHDPSISPIDTQKKAIALGAFNTREQADALKEKFPDDQIYTKNVKSKNGDYFVAYSVNIPKEELKTNLKRIQQRFPTAYVTSDKRVTDLAELYNKDLDKHSKTNTPKKNTQKPKNEDIRTLSISTDLPDDKYFDELFADDYYLDTATEKPKKKTRENKAPVPEKNISQKSKPLIDTDKKAIAIGAFNTKEQADTVTEKFPDDNIYIKKVTSNNGQVYFVSYSVNIKKEELHANLERIKKISPSAYITSDKRVRELAELFNDKTKPLARTKTADKENAEPLQKTKPVKTVHKKQETLSYGNIDISKKAVALGAFFTKEDALRIKEKFPDDRIFIKNVRSKNNSYFVPYSVNIPKNKLTVNLERIKETVPSAYITSDKRVKELAALYNNPAVKKTAPGDKTTPGKTEKDLTVSTRLPGTSITKETNPKPLFYIEQTPKSSFIDRTKRSLTVAKTSTLQKAKEIARTLYNYDVLIKPPVVKNRKFTVYLINIDKQKIASSENEIKKIYPETFQTSRTRLSYFYRQQLKSDIFIKKNSFSPIKTDNKNIKKASRETHGEKKQFDQAKELFRERKYKQALNSFLDLSKNNSDNSNLNFYIGRSYYEIGDYEAAGSYFERITIKDDDNLRAKLELAQTYMKLELYNDAAENFNSVLQSNIPNNVKKNIQNRLEHIKNKQKKHLFGGSFNFNITHDNNSYEVSDTKTFDTLAFQGLQVSDEKYSELSQTALLNLNHIYRLSDRYNIKNSVNIMKKLYGKDDQRLNDPTATGIASEEKKELDLLSYALSLSKYSKNDALTAGIDLSKTDVAGEDYLKTAGVNLSYQRILFRKIRSMLSVKIYNKSYQQLKDKNLDSRNFQFVFGQMLPTGNYGKFNLIYIFSDENKKSPLANGYDSRTSDEYMNTLYLTNFYELTNSLSLQSGILYSLTKTKDSDSTFDTFGIRRKDTLKSIFSQLQYSYDKDITLTAALKYYDNESNIDIYSYDKMLIDFGFIYSF